MGLGPSCCQTFENLASVIKRIQDARKHTSASEALKDVGLSYLGGRLELKL